MAINAEQFATYATVLLGQTTVGVVIPAVILAALLAGLRSLLRYANEHPESFCARLLHDEHDKPSSDRLVKLVATVIASWVVAVVVFALPNLLVEVLTIYVLTFAGADVAKSFARRPPKPPQQPPTG